MLTCILATRCMGACLLLDIQEHISPLNTTRVTMDITLLICMVNLHRMATMITATTHNHASNMDALRDIPSIHLNKATMIKGPCRCSVDQFGKYGGYTSYLRFQRSPTTLNNVVGFTVLFVLLLCFRNNAL